MQPRNPAVRKSGSPGRRPAQLEPRQGGRWETIKYAIDSNARTLRLCLICIVLVAAPVAAALVAELIRHMVLCDGRARLRLRSSGRGSGDGKSSSGADPDG